MGEHNRKACQIQYGILSARQSWEEVDLLKSGKCRSIECDDPKMNLIKSMIMRTIAARKAQSALH